MIDSLVDYALYNFCNFCNFCNSKIKIESKSNQIIGNPDIVGNHEIIGNPRKSQNPIEILEILGLRSAELPGGGHGGSSGGSCHWAWAGRVAKGASAVSLAGSKASQGVPPVGEGSLGTTKEVLGTTKEVLGFPQDVWISHRTSLGFLQAFLGF